MAEMYRVRLKDGRYLKGFACWRLGQYRLSGNVSEAALFSRDDATRISARCVGSVIEEVEE